MSRSTSSPSVFLFYPPASTATGRLLPEPARPVVAVGSRTASRGPGEATVATAGAFSCGEAATGTSRRDRDDFLVHAGADPAKWTCWTPSRC